MRPRNSFAFDRFVLVLFVAIAAAAFAAMPSITFANCGAERCPLSPWGPEASPGRWSFDITYQLVDQDRLWDGTGEIDGDLLDEHVVERRTRSEIWNFGASVNLPGRVRLEGSLPYVQRLHEHDHEESEGLYERQRWEFDGIADATLLAQWIAFGHAESGFGALTLQLGAKLPTGEESVDAIDGETPEPPALLGSGSTDALVGVQVTRNVILPSPGGSAAVPVSLGALGRLHGRGTDDYRMGNELHVHASAGYPLHPSVRLLAQVNVLSQEKDDAGETHAEEHHTGSTTVFVTPGLRFALPGGFASFGYWQFRAYEHTNGPQLVAPSHLVLGASFGWN